MRLHLLEGLQALIIPSIPDIAIPSIDGLVNFVFFTKILHFLNDELGEFQQRLIGDSMAFLGFIALILLTIWIFFQGFRIVSGRSRESMMGLVVDALRATLIIAAATGFAVANTSIYENVTTGLGEVIIGVVTGDDMTLDDMYGSMDKALATMELSLAAVESVQIQESPAVGGVNDDVSAAKTRSLYFAGIGTMGPAVTAGIMLTLNKVAMALFIGLGPIFILCLLFDQTKSLFQRWLLYGIGTLFSLAVLSVMVYLAMDLTLAVAGAMFAGKFLAIGDGAGISNMSLQMGTLGLILTMLLITAPPMAAAFFQGTLGTFMTYSAFNSGALGQDGARGRLGRNGEPPGYPSRREQGNMEIQGETSGKVGGFGNLNANRTPPISSAESNDQTIRPKRPNA